MSRALASLASRYVGRRVRLKSGAVATISRVTAQGFTVTIAGIRAEDIARYLD